jgi:hypothetical protein
MNDQQKALAYDNLMMEHRRLDNQISQIKSENFELNEQQQQQINQLKRKQEELFFRMKSLFN